MNKLIYIENINHRLGNDRGYYFGPFDIQAWKGGDMLPLQFTLHEIEMAQNRARKNVRHLPAVKKIGRIRGWAIGKLGG